MQLLGKKVHFIGIGGVGMSATAKLLRDAGAVVTGSDESVYPPISTMLEKEGLPYRTPYAAANLPEDVELIVIGKNAKLVPESNPEVAAACTSGARIMSFPDVIGELSANKEVIVIAGSYGKSTSTAFMAHCLQSAGRDPSYLIGAIPLSPDVNARLGADDLFILEGDEYPSSNTDPRSKFLLMHPSHLLLTPLAHDHYNVFPTPEDYLKPFRELIELVPADGTIVACVEGPLSGSFLADAAQARAHGGDINKNPIITYGFAHGDFHAANVAWGTRTAFDIMHLGQKIVRVETTQLGVHNIENMIGVGTFLLTRELVTPEQFAVACASFKGIVRRLDRKSEKTSIPIFEGFGSSHEKARSAIAAMKQHFPDRRLVIIFEPHTFSWRNKSALHWYDDVFAGANKIYVYEPAQQGAGTHAQLSQEEIVDRVRGAGFDVEAISDPVAALAQIGADLQANDAILILTSGALGGLIESVPHLAEERFPQ